MLKTLLASGALFQGVKAQLSATAQRAGVILVFGIIALVFFGVGLAALAVAAAIALMPHLGAAGAAASVGGGALVIAALLIWIGTRDRAPKAAPVARPVVGPSYSPYAGLSEALPELSRAAASAPLPLMVGALVLGLVLGRRT
ncbi:phage holin family protein [Terrihabitans sp. B22-R8]|uniref:phage holin family protein n=1 Tax=Terrihabitans sp. B22-R8 TaxID=3425128 RepID=UPI00403C1A75